MKTAIIAATLALALAAPAMADPTGPADCGVPQGYGTSNPHTFNRSTCGLGGDQASSSQVPGGRPAGYGTSNPYIPNSGSANFGSNTDGTAYNAAPAVNDSSANVGSGQPVGYGTTNPYVPNSGNPRPGSN
jgi:hypothetical protein